MSFPGKNKDPGELILKKAGIIRLRVDGGSLVLVSELRYNQLSINESLQISPPQ